MAQDDDGQEKTEEPTARKLEQARERGELPRSPDFGGAFVVVGLCVLMLLAGGSLIGTLKAMVVRSLTFDQGTIGDTQALPAWFGSMWLEGLNGVKWLLLLAFVLALVAPIFNGGFNVSAKAAAPKLSKLNPLNGLKRMFGTQALMGLLRNLLKFFAIAIVLSLVLWGRRDELIASARFALEPMVNTGASIALLVFTLVSIAVAAISFLDVPYQKWSYLRRLRMTKQEVRDEMKDIEGRPEVKQQIRRKQRERSRARMMDNVKEADVIIVNPTEFAVALRHDEMSNGAPVVLAKGRGEIARAIKERGETAGVPRIEAPALARALYYTTDLDDMIPEGLYRPVAAVLAYVYRMSALAPDLARPEFEAPDVPPEFRFDENGQSELARGGEA
jgi:flagellar biosynthetic protein FlhB